MVTEGSSGFWGMFYLNLFIWKQYHSAGVILAVFQYRPTLLYGKHAFEEFGYQNLVTAVYETLY